MRRAITVVSAAGRLAAFQAGASILLFVAFCRLTHQWPGDLHECLEVLGRLFGIAFFTAWACLALVRRFGFTVLWALSIYHWIKWMMWIPILTLTSFVLWSIFALPLYLACAIGFPGRRVAIGRRSVPMPACVAGAWLVVLVATIAATPVEYLSLFSACGSGPPPFPLGASAITPFVWAPLPMLIAAESIVRIHSGTTLRRTSRIGFTKTPLHAHH